MGQRVMSGRCAQTTNVDVNEGWLECLTSLGHLIARFKWNIRATSTVVDPGNVVPVRGGTGGGGLLGETVMSRRCAQTTNVDVNDGWLECCNSLGHLIARFKWKIKWQCNVWRLDNVVLVRGGPSFGDVLGQRGMLSQIPLRSTRPGWHGVQLEITFQSYSPLGFIKGHDNVCYREWDCDELRGTVKGEDHVL